MSRFRKARVFVADFETTVEDDIMKQKEVKVWASAFCEIFTNDKPTIYGNIVDFMNFFYKTPGNFIVYFHNLKFDGSYIIDLLLRNGYTFTDGKQKDMANYQFSAVISEMGQFYNIKIKRYGKFVEFRDSLKLLPFSLARAAKAFQTKYQKLEMEYSGHYDSDIEITPEERKYIENDVLVLRELIEMMFNEEHKELTIGSCCLKEFKQFYEKIDYNNFFPDLSEHECPVELHNKYTTVDDYIRKSYRGGYCYLNPKYKGLIIEKGITFDVNSLYPSQMHSCSGNYYPVGLPKFWQGNYIPDKATKNNRVFFVRFQCKFRLKKNKIPTVQIKGNSLYRGNEYLKSSDVYYNGKYYPTYIDVYGETQDAKPMLTMTNVDYKLFREHYRVEELEIFDGCYFNTEIGLFDQYINKYMDIKMTSEGAKRELAKLFLNNLYGKMASSTDSSYREPYLDLDKNYVRFKLHIENEKKAGYIAIGSMITSYARNFTIRHAQLNHERNNNFIYADTDSLHLENAIFEGLEIHDSKMNTWANEGEWKQGKYIRQKTYIETVETEEGDKVIIKGASMKDDTKNVFINGLKDGTYTLDDFDIGLEIKDTQLKAKRIKGGVLLYPFPFRFR